MRRILFTALALLPLILSLVSGMVPVKIQTAKDSVVNEIPKDTKVQNPIQVIPVPSPPPISPPRKAPPVSPDGLVLAAQSSPGAVATVNIHINREVERVRLS